MGVPKAFVFWKGGLGTEILVFLRHLCFRRAVSSAPEMEVCSAPEMEVCIAPPRWKCVAA